MAAPHKPDQVFAAPVPPFAMPCKIDEGFSEDYRSQMGSDLESAGEPIALDEAIVMSSPHPFAAAARDWLLALPQDLRAELARALLDSLPNHVLADIDGEIYARLRFDPIKMLPQEIISQIFEEFDPATLHKASLVSRDWHVKASDMRLWRYLFRQEGWTFDRHAIKRLVDSANLPADQLERPPSKRSRRPVSMDLGDVPQPFKRLCDTGPSRGSGWTTPASGPSLANTSWLATADAGTAEDHVMQDVDEVPAPPPLRSSLLTLDDCGQAVPNWQNIYNQRRRLERNWINGRFKNFRLPRNGAPKGQAHTQCVYTLQYSNRYVVSGSRDRSVRVWDLETQELKMPPLQGPHGHQGSVLCLQFDERPEQDVIMSGGSDSDVIVWKFSSGKVVKRLRKAHSESVLNLRFDERYLVTCSKDKTIRVWSRTQLQPGDAHYPDKRGSSDATYPSHILDLGQLSVGHPQSASTLLPPYSELMTFNKHGAAVNAIQIHEDEIVSASGDRKIMLWNMKTGSLVRTFTGHTKGIACVQYDGRRIVSGSSDNTVRIFDSTTGAEVALLDGHRHLVRTVQAEFGDLAGAAETLEEEARASDRAFEVGQRGRPARSRIAPYFVHGAKLPPGGGGNKWSKIVSGSYDETVIVWRRDREGRWFIARELRQEDALRLSSQTGGSAAESTTTPLQPTTTQDVATPRGGSADTMQADAPAGGAGAQPPLRPSVPNASAPQVTPHHAFVQAANPTAAQQALQASTASLAPAPPNHHHHHHHHGAAGGHAAPGAAANAGQPHHHHHHHHHQQLVQAQQQAMAAGFNSRVFKLQFDARRIICCSQEPVIVGWDFANDDEAIIEACQYFGEPS